MAATTTCVSHVICQVYGVRNFFSVSKNYHAHYLYFTVILSWFVDSSVAAGAIDGKIIEEDEVEVRPEKITVSCLDENVCLDSTRKYYSQDAWLAVEDVVEALRGNPVNYCGRCTCPIKDETQSFIVCDGYLCWFHF